LIEPLTEEDWRSVGVFKRRAVKLIEELGKLSLDEIVLDFERRPDGGYRNSFTSALTVLSLDDLVTLSRVSRRISVFLDFCCGVPGFGGRSVDALT
jgi:hypothetical protein